MTQRIEASKEKDKLEEWLEEMDNYALGAVIPGAAESRLKHFKNALSIIRRQHEALKVYTDPDRWHHIPTPHGSIYSHALNAISDVEKIIGEK